jgi:hypothetical protein
VDRFQFFDPVYSDSQGNWSRREGRRKGRRKGRSEDWSDRVGFSRCALAAREAQQEQCESEVDHGISFDGYHTTVSRTG